MTSTLILGAGLAGLSASYHLGHSNCQVLEKENSSFGHCRSHFSRGYTWDQGPHVSFTKHEYVKRLFAESVAGEYDEYEVRVGNYFHGCWIDHPAQSNLYQVPEPLRQECLAGFHNRPPLSRHPANYAEWLQMAFGEPFASTFPAAYTRKYWTTEPANLTTEWVGSRMFRPSDDDVTAGSKGPLPRATHYITTVRYPRHGGYQSFGRSMAAGANVRHGATVIDIDLRSKSVRCFDGTTYGYERMISTIPLPIFVRSCRQATPDILEAAECLTCAQLMLVNVEVPHPARRPESWLYVYDETMISTRISFREKLTAGNAPPDRCGIQVEVYGSKYRPFAGTPTEIGLAVVGELYHMRLIDADVPPESIVHSVVSAQWSNIVFDHGTRPALESILRWLEQFGLEREHDDLSPVSDWPNGRRPAGTIVLAGRFGQWKYAWSDDCVLRGLQLGDPGGSA